MNPAFISTIMAPNFEIKEITSGTRRSIPIPNQNIGGCPGGQGANRYNVAQNINGNSPPVGHGSQKMPGPLTFPHGVPERHVFAARY